jgi:hypothetical protein
MTKSKHKEETPKERGCWLSGWLILIALHGVLVTVLILYLRDQQHAARLPWVLPALLLLSLADIVAAVAAWYWKRWGLILYAISTFVGIAVGLVVTRSQLIVFHDIIPLAILGYIVKDKRQLFD